MAVIKANTPPHLVKWLTISPILYISLFLCSGLGTRCMFDTVIWEEERLVCSPTAYAKRRLQVCYRDGRSATEVVVTLVNGSYKAENVLHLILGEVGCNSDQVTHLELIHCFAPMFWPRLKWQGKRRDTDKRSKSWHQLLRGVSSTLSRCIDCHCERGWCACIRRL